MSSAGVKRPRASDDDDESSGDKRARFDNSSTALVTTSSSAGSGGANSSALVPHSGAATISRTSKLAAPNLLLTGHPAAVLALRFDPSGQVLASAGKDKGVWLWRVPRSEGEEAESAPGTGDDEAATGAAAAAASASSGAVNFAVMPGHKNAVLDLSWSADGRILWSASADKTGGAFNVETGARTKTLAGHERIVNSIAAARSGSSLAVTGSDDGFVRMYDLRQRAPATVLTAGCPVLSVCFGESNQQCYSGGLDNTLRQWDLRANRVAMSLRGHTDSITGCRLNAAGSHVATVGMDSTVRIWDVRPFVAGGDAARCTCVLLGATANFEQHLLRVAWSADGERVSSGSADRCVHVWNVDSGREEFVLPGHSGTVTAVDFSPTDAAVLASASADKQIYLGELLSTV